MYGKNVEQKQKEKLFNKIKKKNNTKIIERYFLLNIKALQ